MLADLRTVTTPGDWVITDNAVLAFRAGLLMPPHLADTGGKRWAARPEPDRMWLHETARWQPTAIVFTRSSQRAHEAFLGWVDHSFRLAFRYSQTRRIWTPFAGGPTIDLVPQPLADGVALEGHSLAASVAAPGETARLALFWSAVQPLDEDYQVFVHLIGPDGHLVAQDDGAPVGGEEPTSRWQPGTWVLDPRRLDLPPDTQPGRYEIDVGLYRLTDGQRLGGALRLPTGLTIRKSRIAR